MYSLYIYIDIDICIYIYYIHLLYIHVTYKSAKAATDSGDNRCPKRLHSFQHTQCSFFPIKGKSVTTREQHMFSIQQVLKPVRAKLNTQH